MRLRTLILAILINVHSVAPAIAEPAQLSQDTLVVLQTIILESVGDGFESMVAVGEVIRNRADAFQKSYKEVCLTPHQFSGWNDRRRAGEFLEEHSEYLETAYRAWLASAKGHLTKGATDYHTLSIYPDWAAAYRTVAVVGSHIFYCRN